jgi:CDP-diacylglycerol---glycerol-3-phosphate 3-phosphatidyltransferase
LGSLPLPERSTRVRKMRKRDKTGFWNIPNSITVGRIAAVPVMVWLLWRGEGAEIPSRNMCIITMAIFALAMITDILDGYLARKWGLVSVIGAFLDPLADKLMVTATLIMLVPLGWLPGWIVALLICRELTITALRTIAVSEGLVLKASLWGKYKTASQATALGFLLWHHPTKLFWIIDMDAHACGIALIYVALGFSLWSGWLYLSQFFAHVSNNSMSSES